MLQAPNLTIRFTTVCSVAIVFFFLADDVFACSCSPLPPIYEAFENSDAVFVGKVVSSTEPSRNDHGYDGGDVIFEFEVIEAFKGVAGKTVKLNRGTRNSSCYSGYSIGETYLIYASKRGVSFLHKNEKLSGDVVFQSSFCHRSANVRSSKDQLIYISRLLKKEPEHQIYGSVGRSVGDLVTEEYRYEYLADVKVVLEKDGKSIETRTDKDGLFSFDNVPNGTYILKPVPDESSFVYFPAAEEVTVLSNNAISSRSYIGMDTPFRGFFQDFSLGWKNKFSGRVFDTAGNEFDRYACGPVPLAHPKRELETIVDGSPDSNIRHGFSSIGDLPGKYVLALDVYAPFQGSSKKRYYYPGTENLSEAKIFDVQHTSQFVDIKFRVPFTIRRIKGKFVWKDGGDVNGKTWVEVARLQNDDDRTNPRFGWDVGENGEFSIQVFEGYEYWFSAQVSVPIITKDGERSKTLEVKKQRLKVGKDDIVLQLEVHKPSNLSSGKPN